TPGGGPRRVFSARWVGDDASFADRGGVTSPPFPELTLRDGDPLDSPLFPQVWPRA
ncbi:phytanoyl-CoA dioxygenase family protein, partial [Klebsiella pneumoniae]